MIPAELELRRYAVQGLVAEAGRMALDYFGKQESLGVTMKGAQDWLTVADGAVEDFLRQRRALPCRERAHRRLCRAAHQCLGRRRRHRHRERSGRLDQ